MAWLVSLKILLISSGLVALALAFEFTISNLPTLWTTYKSMLRPPYLYVFINAIIITIAASSMFHHDHPPKPHLPSSSDYEYSTPPSPVTLVYNHVEEVGPPSVDYEHVLDDVAEAPAVEVKEVITSMVVFDDEKKTEEAHVAKDDGEIEVEEVSRSTSNKFDDVVVQPAQKPLVSSRFSHRKPARSNPEGGRPLRVAKAPKRHDTLESTWKTITEGRSVPLSRPMKKSDTLNHHNREIVNGSDEVEDQETYTLAVQKSKTFKDLTNQQREMTLAAVSSTSPAAIRLRKEPSLSQDELNRRVEAFIHKFNEDMRLQRQESLNQYMEMIKRGSN